MILGPSSPLNDRIVPPITCNHSGSTILPGPPPSPYFRLTYLAFNLPHPTHAGHSFTGFRFRPSCP